MKYQWHLHGELLGYSRELQYYVDDDYYRGHDVRLNEYVSQMQHLTALQEMLLAIQRAMNDLNDIEASVFLIFLELLKSISNLINTY